MTKYAAVLFQRSLRIFFVVFAVLLAFLAVQTFHS